MEDQVKLFGSWASPFSRRIEPALKLKGIQFENGDEDEWNRSDLRMKDNPFHEKVPVLVHNGRVISESLVILEYIDETWNHHPILPREPYHRAQARFWAKHVDEKIFQSEMRIGSARDEEKDQIIEEVHHHLKFLEEELGDKEYFGGEKIGYLDIVVGFMGNWFQARSEVTKVDIITEHHHPKLHKWFKKLHRHDVVYDCFPPREKHIDFIRARFDDRKFPGRPDFI